MYDVAIIGGGVVGGMLARELSRYQLSVVILEKEYDVAMGASKANSGIVHGGFDAKPDTLKARLNVRGCEMMPTVAAELGVPYRNNGSLVVAQDEESLAAVRELYQRGVENGVPAITVLDEAALRELAPAVKGIAALYAPSAGIVCPYTLTVAAIGNAMDNGVELRRGFGVDRIEKTTDGYVLYAAEDTVETRYVVNAAGVHADDIARLVRDDYFRITPRAGEYILLDKEAGCVVEQTVFGAPSKMGKGILVSPTTHGNLLLGPTATDIENKEDTATTYEGLQKVIGGANRMVEGVPVGKAITSFCGLRSTPDRYDFIIEPSPSNPHFLHLAGIESPGLSSSPAIAEYAVELLGQMGLALTKKTDFNPIRERVDAFRHLSDEEKNEIIRKDSRYGRIVCRCEQVTEGEIVAAIHRNPGATDTDGIKRRTRGGMGRCQGGFCQPVVAEILARELGIPLQQVTKSGGSSYLLTDKTK
ncbi:MAG: NAD(P)/FAD-dependent oxidoreductase [Clostridia bacterium]|nr:NAD(P)/FAD-dependent oxidoreductase [Clostridia bacterium]